MGPRALASVPPVYLSVPNCPYDLDNLPATFQGPYGTGLEPYGMGESPRTQQDKDPPPQPGLCHALSRVDPWSTLVLDPPCFLLQAPL